ncbi:MAG: hypothetical protein ABR991_07280, partial [Terracidiphilus sp.]
ENFSKLGWQANVIWRIAISTYMQFDASTVQVDDLIRGSLNRINRMITIRPPLVILAITSALHCHFPFHDKTLYTYLIHLPALKAAGPFLSSSPFVNTMNSLLVLFATIATLVTYSADKLERVRMKGGTKLG